MLLEILVQFVAWSSVITPIKGVKLTKLANIVVKRIIAVPTVA